MQWFLCPVVSCFLLLAVLLLAEADSERKHTVGADRNDRASQSPKSARDVKLQRGQGNRPQQPHYLPPNRGRRPHHRQHTKHHSGPNQPLPQDHAPSRNEGGQGHDLLDCQPAAGDRLLARSVVKSEFRPLAFAETSWFYPQSGSDKRTIHCVRVLDQRRDGKGGYPRVVRGGVGHHFVEINFKSDFSRGFHFIVEIYGL